MLSINAEYTRIQSVITAVAKIYGWALSTPEDVIYSKSFPTIQAHMGSFYMHSIDQNSHGLEVFSLKGTFLSSGENAMALCYCFITENDNEETIKHKVAKYLNDADKWIGRSFAMRCMRVDA